MSGDASDGRERSVLGLAARHPSPLSGASYSAVELLPGDRAVLLLDQRLLPREERYDEWRDVESVARAIESLAVRGAPAIGIAAGYGLVLAAAGAEGEGPAAFAQAMDTAANRLRRTRPTAVNLAWAIARMGRVAVEVAGRSGGERVAHLAAEARAIHSEDVAACKAIGAIGAAHVPDGATVLTHCNAGALATGGYGTALGVVRAAREAGKRVRVIACETRPVLQGARLTAWELARDGFDVTLVTDSMVAQLMKRGAVTLVVVGADRVARSGDVANKIGTYGVACLAHAHGVPFYVAAPWSTVDLGCPHGDAIPIEQRSEGEVLAFAGTAIAPPGVHADNPSFDVTPARLVHALFTERGEVAPLGEDALLRRAC
jgi:methylthioribose-1-phosphate isomerase